MISNNSDELFYRLKFSSREKNIELKPLNKIFSLISSNEENKLNLLVNNINNMILVIDTYYFKPK